MKKQILAFELKNEKRKAVMQICRQMGIHIIEVEPKEYNRTLGELSGMQVSVNAVKFPSGTFKPFPKEMIIFTGLGSEDLDQFLAAYKKTGAPKIDLKAGLTPVNAGWTPVMLFMELMKEHATMMAR